MNYNNNHKIIRRLAGCGYDSHKQRNIVTIAAIALTTMMFTTIFAIGFTLIDGMAALGISGTASGAGIAQGFVIAAAAVSAILISGYLIISNIFEASITQDIQYYGLLKTIGTTKPQLKRIIRKQACRLCRIGIPAGLIIGYGIGGIIVPKVLASVGPAVKLSINPLLFVGSALFALVTVFFSTNKPVKVASKVSPVQALKFMPEDKDNGAMTKKSNHNLTPKKMAGANLKSNKKLNFRVILSISLGLTLMNTFYVYQNSYDQEAYVDGFIGQDIAILSTPQESITPAVAESLNETLGVTAVGEMYYVETQQALNPQVMERMVDYYQNNEGASGWVETDEDALRQFEQIKSTGTTTVSVFGADQLASEAGPVYLGEFDTERFQSGNYVVAFGIAGNGEGSVHYEIGDEIEIAGQSYELMAMMDPRSTITDDHLRDSLSSLDNKLEIVYMIPKKTFLKSFSDGRITGIYADVENEDQLGVIIERMSDAYPELRVESKDTYRLRFDSQVLAQVVLGYTLGLIMAVVGILNFVNSMLTAIITRKREFAMLESIGMTKKQIRQMLIHEGMSYSKWSLVISIVLSTLVANTWVANSVSESWVAAYHFSLAPFILIIPLMLVLAYQIPMICFKGVQKKSLVERLRETA